MKYGIMVAACATAFAMVGPTIAQAQTPTGYETTSVEVRYSDLDLSTAAGRKHLDRRFAAAIRQVCGDVTARDLSTTMAARQCASTAKRSALPAIQVATASARSKAVRV